MAMSNEELLALARELPIPDPWHRDTFITNISQLRGRPIHLVPTNTVLTASPCGLWMAGDDQDVIVHEIGTSDYHIDQIVCHEIGHMMLGHGLGAISADHPQESVSLVEEVLPNIDPASVRALLGRSNFKPDQERDAEMFASMVMLVAREGASAKSVMRSVFLNRQ